MKKIWRLRYVIVIASVLLFVGVCLEWAVTHYPYYVGAGIAFLVLIIIVDMPFARRRKARIRATVEAAFQLSYQTVPVPPALVMSYSYGYPAFEIKFRSKSELEASANQNGVFKDEIDKIFEGHGTRSRQFSADQAIFFTYDGYLDELRARYKTASLHASSPSS